MYLILIQSINALTMPWDYGQSYTYTSYISES